METLLTGLGDRPRAVGQSGHGVTVTCLALCVALASVALTARGGVTVGDVTVNHLSGTDFVEILYDLQGGASAATVSLEASNDGGATWTVPTVSATGAIGSGVPMGADRSILWDAGVDWSGQSSSRVFFRVIAEDWGQASPGSFVLVEPGTAPGGSPMVEYFYYIDKYEVTRSEMVEILNYVGIRYGASAPYGIKVVSTTFGSAVQNRYGDPQELLYLDNKMIYGGPWTYYARQSTLPCAKVTWYGAVVWCNIRSEKEGLTPCYNLNDWSCDFSANGYRLPTSEEWEYAARGGKNGLDTIYSGGNNLDEVAWHQENSIEWPNTVFDPGAAFVGAKAPNELGLYDMNGNVGEWCWDSPDGSSRIARGGSWRDSGLQSYGSPRYNPEWDYFRLSYTYSKMVDHPYGAWGDDYTGFRAVRTRVAPSDEGFLIWNGRVFSVSYAPEGGSLPVDSTSVVYGSEYGTLATPERSGYAFAGWWTGENGTSSQVTSGTTVSTVGNHTLYARWTPNTYTVAYDAEGGSVSPSSKTVLFGIGYGSLATPGRAGYSFAGWCTEDNGTGSQVISSTTVATIGNHTLHAKWTVNQYILFFNSAGGTAVTSITQDFGTLVTPPTPPSRTGYIFAGWNPSVPATMPSDNTTLTAQWTAMTYTLTYNATGGWVSPSQRTVSYGSGYSLLATPTLLGNTFGGWWTGEGGTGSEVVSSTVVTTASDHTLHAKWAVNEYTLFFDSGLGTPVEPITQDYDTPVTPPSDPTRTGHVFSGWNPTVPARMPAGGTTLTAQWTAKTYTVTFNAEGGSVSPEGNTVTYGAAYGDLPTPELSGYTFDGWWNGAGGTGVEVTPETVVSTAGNHLLYAKWVVNTYTVDFDAEGGTVPSESKVVTYDAPYGDLPAPERDGYTFCGWWTGEGGTGSEVVSSTIVTTASDHILHAKWAVNEYTLFFDSGLGAPVKPITQDYDTPVTPPSDPTRTGYTFSGWNPTVPARMPAGSGALTAQWTAKTCTVTFNAEGGSVSPESNTVTYDAAYGDLPTPELSGYTFDGWWNSTGGTGVEVTPETAVSTAITHLLYAKWVVNTYTLTYDADGNGSVVGASSQVVDHGGKGSTVEAVPSEDYLFIAWSDGSTMNPRTDENVIAGLSVTANFGLPFHTALETTDLPWTTGGEGKWRTVESHSHDGSDSAWSGEVADAGMSWLQTTVNGSGVLSFWWQVSSEEHFDFMRLRVDGDIRKFISGEKDWVRGAIRVEGEGDHVLRWEYAKDGSESANQDCGWVDEVTWAPDLSGFALWASGKGLSGDAATLLGQDRNGDGIANVFDYAFGTNLNNSLLLNIIMVNGKPMVEIPARDGDTLPYVDVRVLGSINLIDWTLPVSPVPGAPFRREWFQPQGDSEKAFFKLEAKLK